MVQSRFHAQPSAGTADELEARLPVQGARFSTPARQKSCAVGHRAPARGDAAPLAGKRGSPGRHSCASASSRVDWVDLETDVADSIRGFRAGTRLVAITNARGAGRFGRQSTSGCASGCRRCEDAASPAAQARTASLNLANRRSSRPLALGMGDSAASRSLGRSLARRSPTPPSTRTADRPGPASFDELNRLLSL